MIKQWISPGKLLILLVALVLPLVGCNANDDENAGNDNGANTENVKYDPDNGNDNNNDNVNNNKNANNDNGVNNDMNNGDEDNNRFEIADKAAEQITNLDKIRRANVIVTDDNAYVAAVLKDENNGLNQDIKQSISKQVKSVDGDIDNVYVSTNPDFVDRVENYGDKLQQGKPVEGLGEEINNMVQRLFPQGE
ncbi:YhcN/YlaJ family sporulation lipoprotein [Tuberibacillus sp. Marseille-P3662]|uniref:YhcN/YlaJ family sporulation lipoprotein n=1 Tax=Tuberibacillus sp. Marseille-P3662 TaxID=1965358 RepID=UPI000A1CEABA|nr:YhcN/YlaJ family sporulation lipoprotein [Tuberibacillus sp. Marseille-P3662]